MDQSSDIVVLSDDDETPTAVKKLRNTHFTGQFTDIFIESETIVTKHVDLNDKTDRKIMCDSFTKELDEMFLEVDKTSAEERRKAQEDERTQKVLNVREFNTHQDEIFGKNPAETVESEAQLFDDELEYELDKSVDEDGVNNEGAVLSAPVEFDGISSPERFSATDESADSQRLTTADADENEIGPEVGRRSTVSLSLSDEAATSSTTSKDQPDANEMTGEEVGGPPTKRKRRTREEIEQEKLLKQVNKIRREMAAAKNSKCEQYLFCYVSPNILAIDDNLAEQLTLRFTERGIAEQLIFVPPADAGGQCDESVVAWRRKQIDAYVEDGKLHNHTSMIPVCAFMAVLDAESFTALVKNRVAVMAFIEKQLAACKVSNPQLTVVVVGKCTVRDSTINNALFEAFERFRAQFCFTRSALDFSFSVAQMHRAIAKREKKSDYEVMDLPVIAMEKGVRDGPELVRDWWCRMLDHVHRLGVEQKRALVERYPSPAVLMRALLAAESAGEAMYQLANLPMASGGKCLGPVVAQKLYLMLTSWNGEEIIHSCS